MTVFLTAMLPATFVTAVHRASAMNPNTGAMPTGVLAETLEGFIIVLFSIFLIILPLAFLLFYRRQDIG